MSQLTHHGKQFLDGGSYLKHKLELHVLAIEERRIRTEQAEKEAVVAGVEGREEPVKEEDVKRLVSGASVSLLRREADPGWRWMSFR